MKKLAIEETFPSNVIGKNMVFNKMKSHYKRIFSAKAKVDTNLPKSPKTPRALSREIYEIVNRNYYCNNVPKHRRCLKELSNSQFRFKPIILNTSAESKLKNLNVYHPPVRTPRKLKKEEDQIAEIQAEKGEEELDQEDKEPDVTEDLKEPMTVVERGPKIATKEISVQTEDDHRNRLNAKLTYRPVSARSIHFLRDITDEVLRKGVYTDGSLERIFNYHVTVNKHNLDLETMENEVDRLRQELGMRRPGQRRSVHSDEEALEALNSLVLPDNVREDIINSLGLRSSEKFHSTILESMGPVSEVLPKPERLNEGLSQKIQVENINGDILSLKETEGKQLLDNTSTTSEVSDIQDLEFEEDEKNDHTIRLSNPKRMSVDEYDKNLHLIQAELLQVPADSTSVSNEINAIQSETDDNNRDEHQNGNEKVESENKLQSENDGTKSDTQSDQEHSEKDGNNVQSHSESEGGVESVPESHDNSVVQEEAEIAVKVESERSSHRLSAIIEENSEELCEDEEALSEMSNKTNGHSHKSDSSEMSSIHTETE